METNYTRRESLEIMLQTLTAVALPLTGLGYYFTRKEKQDPSKEYVTKTWDIEKGKVFMSYPKKDLEEICIRQAQSHQDILQWCNQTYLNHVAKMVLNHQRGRKNYEKLQEFVKNNIKLTKSSQLNHPLKVIMEGKGNLNEIIILYAALLKGIRKRALMYKNNEIILGVQLKGKERVPLIKTNATKLQEIAFVQDQEKNKYILVRATPYDEQLLSYTLQRNKEKIYFLD